MDIDKFNEEIGKVMVSLGEDLIVIDDSKQYEEVIPKMDLVIENAKAAVDSIYNLCKTKQITATGPQVFSEFVLQASLLLVKYNNMSEIITNGEENA